VGVGQCCMFAASASYGNKHTLVSFSCNALNFSMIKYICNLLVYK
jgi:hypothetical protein